MGRPVRIQLPSQGSELRAKHEAQADDMLTARALLKARTQAGLTQAEVAERMGTTQSTVARLEGGKSTPSLNSVRRYAKAVGYRAIVRLVHD